MANKVKQLPWELTEEILSRVPPTSLVRFRTVCKQWNALFNDKKFINSHKATFRFILSTKSKIYSVSIDPKIEIRELTIDVPGLESKMPKKLIDSNGFLLCEMDEGATVWNPWLKQTKWINGGVNQNNLEFSGIGYEYNNGRLAESVYKTFASNKEGYKTWWKVHDFASDEWKKLSGYGDDRRKDCATIHPSNCVSLNGILYWVTYYDRADPLYHLHNFEFSREKILKFCDLPCGNNHHHDSLVLKVFRGDRFSLLKQWFETKKIEIWVTKNKINYKDGDDVVWMNFMTLSVPNFPGLAPTEDFQPSYFIDDKRLVVCSCDENGQAWIYVARDNKLIRKIKIDSVVDPWPLHCTYLPSLTMVPRCERVEADIPSLIPVPPDTREETDLQPEKRSRVA